MPGLEVAVEVDEGGRDDVRGYIVVETIASSWDDGTVGFGGGIVETHDCVDVAGSICC